MKRRDFVAAAASAPFAGSVLAQDKYPNKPIRLIVPFAPGGSSSIVARAFTGQMSKALGQEILVDNRPGACRSLIR